MPPLVSPRPSSSITRFRIESLHGRTTITVPIRDNRLILVGENGTGKSTVANLIYYVLTQQWKRVKEYKFASIEVAVSGGIVHLTHDEVDTLVAYPSGPISTHFRARYVPHMTKRMYDELIRSYLLTDPIDEKEALSNIVEELGVPYAVARRVWEDLLESRENLPKDLLEKTKFLTSMQFGQFLYLPTYRRIEQDLKSIFRGIEIEEKVREFRERFRKREKTTYIELVEFGMEDVEKTIQIRMAQIKENVRTGLSTLTGTYLREVLRGAHGPADVEFLRSIDPRAFPAIFARIDEAILPASDKKLLQEKITEIAQGRSFGSDDKVIAHFLSKLVSLFQEQQTNEADVREFVELCNAYLTGKQFVYDDINYSIYIRQVDYSMIERESERLELKMLSSGEKQIVSLFSHMYLSGEHDFFVIIDEPELSLSVPWQQRFLPDIINTGRCTGILAVTHSPFVWDNVLEPSVQSLGDLVEPSNVIR